MSKKALIFGLFVALVASSVGGAFSASNAQAAYPYGDLICSPSVQSVVSGGYVSFSAYYVNVVSQYPGQLTWTAVNGYPTSGYGSTFGTQFYTGVVNETRLVTVTDGLQSATCTVYVYNGVTPTPTPSTYVSVSHAVRNITRGDVEANSVSAYSGDRLQFVTTVTTGNQQIVNFRVADTLPSYMHFVSGSTTVNGAWYADAIATSGLSLGTLPANSTYTIRFDATVDSGAVGYTTLVNTMSITSDTVSSQTRTSSILLNGYSYWTPTPTPYYVTSQTQVTTTGRNLTLGQSREYTSLRARGGDTLDLIVRVRSTNGAYLTNAYVTDILPSGLMYIPRSTSVNGIVVADGITSSGIAIGAIAPNSVTTVKFSVRVDSAYVPSLGTVTLNNIAQVRADGLGTMSVQTPVTIGMTIAAISSVKTGPADAMWLALLVAMLATGAYAMYTRTDLFGRRMAIAEIKNLSRKNSLNFSR
jgi:uncharacterized repeat protein (TIGR01451 family)